MKQNVKCKSIREKDKAIIALVQRSSEQTFLKKLIQAIGHGPS